METTAEILNNMNTVLQAVREDVSYFVLWGRFFAAMGGLYMIIIVYQRMMGAQQFMWDPIVKIFVVWFFLGFYTQILGGVDAIFNQLGETIHSQALSISGNDWREEVKTHYLEKGERLTDNLQETENNVQASSATEKHANQVAEEAGVFDEFSSLYTKVKSVFSKAVDASLDIGELFMEFIKNSLDNLLINILQSLCMFLFYCLLAIRVFFLTVLYLVGPIAVGFSLFPGFENTIVNWGARYIKTSLWLPIGFLLESVLSVGAETLLQNYAKVNVNSLLPIPASNSKIMIFGTLAITAIISYFMIPKLAGWVINASGISSAASQLKNNIKSPVTTVTNTISKSIGKK